jgi:hypothetical protein
MNVDLNLLIDLALLAVQISWSVLNWAWNNVLMAGPLLLAMYLVLMRVWLMAKGQWWERPFKIVGGIIFLPLDAFVNIVVCTPLFLDAPRYLFVTHRMGRYKETRGIPSKWGVHGGWLRAWRYWFAVKLCNILDVPQQRLTGTNHCQG